MNQEELFSKGIVLGQNDFVGEFVASKIPTVREVSKWGNFESVGFIRDNEFIAGFVLNNYTGFEVQVSAAAISPKWCTRGNLGLIAYLVFDKLNCKRLTAICGRNNKKARKLVEGLGFKLEGVQRLGLDGIEDACLYGLLRKDCKWLEYYNGKEEEK
jgi:RimJ/RimL family protein N-acetyltransferase